MSKLGNSLAARVAGYSAAYDFCANSDKLQSCLQDWSKVTIQRVATALGIDIATLPPDARWFLGLEK